MVKDLTKIVSGFQGFTDKASEMVENFTVGLPEEEKQKYKSELKEANMQMKQVQDKLKGVMSDISNLQSKL